MTKEEVLKNIESLDAYVQSQGYKGYDPYDILNSKFNPLRLGKLPAAILTQIQKRNPVNIRPLLRIDKEHNPKAMGLFLGAYSKLYAATNNKQYLEKANWLFNWLIENQVKDFEGTSWGYNFGWANPGKVVPRFSPNLVVTGFISKGMFEYAKINPQLDVVSVIKQVIHFIEKYLQVSEDESGICYSYTTLERDKCYNASLQAGEIFAWYYSKTGIEVYKLKAQKLANFVLSRQLPDGSWNYSESLDGTTFRSQFDFHQGYVIESLAFIQKHIGSDKPYEEAIQKGFDFYRQKLMLDSGQTIYRFPKKYPVEIHNQTQAIISCAEFGDIQQAERVLAYTNAHMRSDKGYYFYKKYPLFTIKTPYIRWAQAWMLMAMACFYTQMKK